METGLIGLLVLVADVWAGMNILHSQAGMGSKAIWLVLILVLPLLGVVIWFVAGPREAPRT